jgi:ABC-type multidrug transport system fused ATPase/permease subunit
MIRRALSIAIQGRTAFIIAHRLSTVRASDQILIVEKGQIVERGQHDELLSRCGRYHELYLSQHSIEIDRLEDCKARSTGYSAQS